MAFPCWRDFFQAGYNPSVIPIVLHHGVLGFKDIRIGRLKLLSYFGGGIETAIAQRGHPVIVSRVHPTAGVATRARELKQTILRHLDLLGRRAEGVVILAHSMGGLDARHMITHLAMDRYVRALVTISTPHRGSPYADWCEKNFGQRLGALGVARLFGLNIQAMHDLTTRACRLINEQTPDSPLVRYYSISGAKPCNKLPPFATHSWRIIHRQEGDNDALVSVKSSIWGKHLGIWAVDHLHGINKRLVMDSMGLGNVTPLYLRLLDRLQEEGVQMKAKGEGTIEGLESCPPMLALRG